MAAPRRARARPRRCCNSVALCCSALAHWLWAPLGGPGRARSGPGLVLFWPSLLLALSSALGYSEPARPASALKMPVCQLRAGVVVGRSCRPRRRIGIRDTGDADPARAPAGAHPSRKWLQAQGGRLAGPWGQAAAGSKRISPPRIPGCSAGRRGHRPKLDPLRRVVVRSGGGTNFHHPGNGAGDGRSLTWPSCGEFRPASPATQGRRATIRSRPTLHRVVSCRTD